MIFLPSPQTKGKVSLEEAIAKRRSKRDFLDQPLTLSQLSQILWAAQGITLEEWGTKYRSAPSAGALYPLELYLVVRKAGGEGLETGVYHYLPEKHSLELHHRMADHQDFVTACLGQEACDQAPVTLVMTAVYERTMVKYGERGRQYVHLEAGHAAENICLQVVTLDLGTVTIGAFVNDELGRVLNLPQDHQPLYILPIGWPRS